MTQSEKLTAVQIVYYVVYLTLFVGAMGGLFVLMYLILTAAGFGVIGSSIGGLLFAGMVAVGGDG